MVTNFIINVCLDNVHSIGRGENLPVQQCSYNAKSYSLKRGYMDNPRWSNVCKGGCKGNGMTGEVDKRRFGGLNYLFLGENMEILILYSVFSQ